MVLYSYYAGRMLARLPVVNCAIPVPRPARAPEGGHRG